MNRFGCNNLLVLKGYFIFSLLISACFSPLSFAQNNTQNNAQDEQLIQELIKKIPNQDNQQQNTPQKQPDQQDPNARTGQKQSETEKKPQGQQGQDVQVLSSGNTGTMVPIKLVAVIKEGGLPITSDIVWRVFEGKPDKAGKYKLLSTHRNAQPTAALKPGDYLINAAYGRAHLTKKITVQAGQALNEIFIMNAGGLKIGSALANGTNVDNNTVRYSIYSDERDQSGNREKIIGEAKPGVIIRLNAGIYHIVSRYGDANAIVEADVTIEPGKLTEATVNHVAAKVTFKLVFQAGGEALADTKWSVMTQHGDVVKDSAGALPTHILAAGTYTILARRAGQVFKKEFEVKAGETKEIEVVIQ